MSCLHCVYYACDGNFCKIIAVCYLNIVGACTHGCIVLYEQFNVWREFSLMGVVSFMRSSMYGGSSYSWL